VIGIFAKGVFGRRENEKREIEIRKTINWRERVLFFKKKSHLSEYNDKYIDFYKNN
jgi:hypothetical protein